MIKRVINKRELRDSSIRDDLSYWLGRSPEERVAAVEILRLQYNGSSARLQRSARVIERAQG